MPLGWVTGLWIRVSPMKRWLIQTSPEARLPATRTPPAIAAAMAVTNPESVSAVRLRRRRRLAAATSVSGQITPSIRAGHRRRDGGDQSGERQRGAVAAAPQAGRGN